MKKIINTIFPLYIIFILASCGSDNPVVTPTPTPEDTNKPINISKDKVEINIGEVATIALSGGDGTFKIKDSQILESRQGDEIFYDINIEGNKLTIVAINSVKANIIIESGNGETKTIGIDIPQTTFNQDKRTSVYDVKGNVILWPLYTARRHNAIVLTSSVENPYAQHIIITEIDKEKLKIGSEVSLTIENKGYQGIKEGKETYKGTVTSYYEDEQMYQIVSNKYRFFIPK